MQTGTICSFFILIFFLKFVYFLNIQFEVVLMFVSLSFGACFVISIMSIWFKWFFFLLFNTIWMENDVSHLNLKLIILS